jgi:hypothetical protein
MEHHNVSRISKQFKKTFSEEGLNEVGKAVRFCLRKRAVTPFRLAMGLIEVFADATVDTIADIQRAFNALCNTNVQYKPFHNQLAKEEFPIFMRSVCATLLEQLACSALHFNQASPFTRFERIILQDGTSFSVHAALEAVFPGRFKATNPAAVELHVAMDLLTEQVESVVLTPDTDSEAQYLPAPETLVGALVIGDRGYFKKEYLFEVDREGGHFIIKGKSDMNPTVKCALTEDGREIKCWRNQKLKNIKHKLRKNQRMDMDVCWQIKGELFTCRLVVSWNPQTKTYQYLLTNLAREQFSIDHVIDGYTLRWQIELLFKEWKSYANLRAFDTEKVTIAEGLIWAALCAAILKRYCAHLTQRLLHVPISTRKVAMCGRHFLPAIFQALMYCPRQLTSALRHAFEYLSKNAQRAHPKRDGVTGRSKTGLAPVFGMA